MKPYMWAVAATVLVGCFVLVGVAGGSWLSLIAALAFAVGSALAALAADRTLRLHHVHDWQVRGVYSPGGLFGPAQDVTRVLYRCPCRELKTVTVEGVWTVDDVTGDVTADQDQAIANVTRERS